MKILWQLCFLFALCFVGEIASSLLPFPFPASVISLLILLFLLCIRAVKPEQIRETSDFLLKNMAFFFLEQFAVIQSQIPILLFIIAVTLVLTFLASSLTVTAVIRWMEKRERKGQKDGSL